MMESRINRRILLQGSLRYLTLAGMAALALVLWRRRSPDGSVCNQQGLCNRCNALDGCRLPLAMKYKTRTKNQKSRTKNQETRNKI